MSWKLAAKQTVKHAEDTVSVTEEDVDLAGVASRLTSGLASEYERWGQEIEKFGVAEVARRLRAAEASLGESWL